MLLLGLRHGRPMIKPLRRRNAIVATLEIFAHIIERRIYFINSAKDLLDKVLTESSTIVRMSARRAFEIMRDHTRYGSNELIAQPDRTIAPSLLL